jgi:hypothetical protein
MHSLNFIHITGTSCMTVHSSISLGFMTAVPVILPLAQMRIAIALWQFHLCASN